MLFRSIDFGLGSWLEPRAAVALSLVPLVAAFATLAMLLREPKRSAASQGSRSGRTPYRDGTIASTRSGLPEPRTILSGAAINNAPVGGSWSRFARH